MVEAKLGEIAYPAQGLPTSEAQQQKWLEASKLQISGCILAILKRCICWLFDVVLAESCPEVEEVIKQKQDALEDPDRLPTLLESINVKHSKLERDKQKEEGANQQQQKEEAWRWRFRRLLLLPRKRRRRSGGR